MPPPHSPSLLIIHIVHIYLPDGSNVGFLLLLLSLGYAD